MFDKEKYRKVLEEDHNNFSELQKNYLEKIYNSGIDNIKQRRELFKHITLITLGALALTPVLIGEIRIQSYFNAGIILEVIVIFLLLNRLREDIDEESKRLMEQLQLENNIDKILSITNKYLLLEINEINAKSWAEERSKSSMENSKELKKKQEFDYFLEVVLFLFILGISSTLGSVLMSSVLNLYQHIYIVLAGAIITFIVGTNYIILPINSVLNYVNTDSNRNKV